MSTFHLKLLTPEQNCFDGEVTAVMVTCENGCMAVLAGHAPMVAMLVEGPMTIRTQAETIEGVAGRGILQVDRKGTAVLVHSFRRAGDEVPKDTAEEDTAARDALLL